MQWTYGTWRWTHAAAACTVQYSSGLPKIYLDQECLSCRRVLRFQFSKLTERMMMMISNLDADSSEPREETLRMLQPSNFAKGWYQLAIT